MIFHRPTRDSVGSSPSLVFFFFGFFFHFAPFLPLYYLFTFFFPFYFMWFPSSWRIVPPFLPDICRPRCYLIIVLLALSVAASPTRGASCCGISWYCFSDSSVSYSARLTSSLRVLTSSLHRTTFPSCRHRLHCWSGRLPTPVRNGSHCPHSWCWR